MPKQLLCPFTLLFCTFLSNTASAITWPTDSGPTDGWKHIDGIGNFYSQAYDSEWIYHQDLRWVYVHGNDLNNLWLYPQFMTWSWSAQDLFPWTWSSQYQTWEFVAGNDDICPFIWDPVQYYWRTDNASIFPDRHTFTPLENISTEFLMEVEYPETNGVLPENIQIYTGISGDQQLYFAGDHAYPHQIVQLIVTAESYSPDGFPENTHLKIKHVQVGGLPNEDRRQFYAVSTETGTIWMPANGDEDLIPTYTTLPAGENHWSHIVYSGRILNPGFHAFRVQMEYNGTLLESIPNTIALLNIVPPTSPTLENNLYADSGFRPELNGFSFANHGYSIPANLDEEAAIEILGADEAAYQLPNGEYVLKASARKWIQDALDFLTGGHCLGFAYSSSLIYEAYKQSGAEAYRLFNPDAEKAFDLRRHHMARYIAKNAVIQLSGTILDEAIAQGKEIGPTGVFYKIHTEIKEGRVPVIGVFTPDMTGGHAFSAYAIRQVSGDVYDVYIYDNNYVADYTRIIRFDLNANTWFYGTGQTDPQSETLEYHGDVTTGNIAIVTLEDFATFERGMPTGDLRVSSTPPLQLLIYNEEKQIGYDRDTNSFVFEWEGAEPVPALNDGQPPMYNIPPESDSDDVPNLESEEDIDKVLKQIVLIEAFLPDASSASDLSLSVDGNSIRLGIDSFSLTSDQSKAFGFHPSGRIIIVYNEDLSSSNESFYFATDDPNQDRGFLYDISNLLLESDQGIIFFVAEDFSLHAFLINDEGAEPAGENTFDVVITEITPETEIAQIQQSVQVLPRKKTEVTHRKSGITVTHSPRNTDHR